MRASQVLLAVTLLDPLWKPPAGAQLARTEPGLYFSLAFGEQLQRSQEQSLQVPEALLRTEEPGPQHLGRALEQTC